MSVLNVEASFSQDLIPATGQPYAVYLLVKILPDKAATRQLPRLPLNLSLLIDNSGSMHAADGRIHLALEAARTLVGQLAEDDFISLVAFAEGANVVLPATPASLANRSQILAAIETVLKSPSGGTNMAVGMQAAAAELNRYLSPHRTNRALILTDGRTDNAPACLQLAQNAARQGISFSAFGLGFDWNETLLRQLADRSGGRWYFIARPDQIAAAFDEELGLIQATAFNNLRLDLKLFAGDALRDVRLVSPEVRDLAAVALDNRTQQVELGALPKDVPYYVLATLLLANRAPGRYNIASIKLGYDGLNQNAATVGPLNLVLGYTDDEKQVVKDGEVLRWADVAQVDQLVRRGTELAVAGEIVEATRLLQNAAALTQRSHDAPKTKLINDVLAELNASGGLSRPTQLGALNQSRKTRLMDE